MQRLLREPLLHFLLLGVAIFIAYGLVSTPGSGSPSTIVVTTGQVEHLADGFATLWGRPPTDAELQGLVDDWVREEVATREALALGLDKDDPVIRRRLRQKLEFLSDDAATQTAATDAELNAYLQAHPEQFLVEPRLSFRQVYLDPEQHRDRLDRDTAQVLAQLTRYGDETTSGDSTLLPHALDDVPASDVAKQFGDAFAATLMDLPVGKWQGPIESSYGVHLVLVSERTEARLPELSDVRDAVQLEWTNARRQDATASFYGKLLERYTVTVEGPHSSEDRKRLAETQ
jgi:hypothetical protein